MFGDFRSVIHGSYGYGTVIVREQNVLRWYELLGEAMATLCDRAVALGAIEDVNLAARRAFWNMLAGPSSFVTIR